MTKTIGMATGVIGYGGYNYMPGRWKSVAEKLIHKYNLTNTSSVLDVACGKAYLLYEMKLLLPGLRVKLVLIFLRHGLEDAKKEVRDSLFVHSAKDPFSFSLIMNLIL